MLRLNCLLTVAILTLCFSVSEVYAQRTSDKSFFLSVSPGLTVGSIPSVSGEIAFGQYLLNSYWDASVKVSHWNHLLTDDGKDRFDQLAWRASAGWKYRVASTYSRFFNLYLGGDAFLGVAQYKVFHHIPANYSDNIPGERFIYGIEPAVELEFFLGQRLALLLEGQCPLTFGHHEALSKEWWNITASIGLRINF